MQNKGLNESHSKEEQLTAGLNEVWIKRDDLIHPIISGNKWRKLKYIVDHCLENNINHIVTYGGAYSNHAIATACTCALFGIQCTIIVRGEKPANPNHYTLLIKSFNAKIVYVSRASYSQKEQVLADLKFDINSTLILPEGGAHELALQGCGEIITELENSYDAIFIASGTGTTAKGIAKRISELELETNLYVIPVLKNEDEIKSALKDYPKAKVIKNAHFGGYAKTDPGLFRIMEEMLAAHGILLDPVYTAKAYIAMLDFMQTHKWSDQKVLFVHTGGQLGLFSEPMQKAWIKSLVESDNEKVIWP